MPSSRQTSLVRTNHLRAIWAHRSVGADGQLAAKLAGGRRGTLGPDRARDRNWAGVGLGGRGGPHCVGAWHVGPDDDDEGGDGPRPAPPAEPGGVSAQGPLIVPVEGDDEVGIAAAPRHRHRRRRVPLRVRPTRHRNCDPLRQAGRPPWPPVVRVAAVGAADQVQPRRARPDREGPAAERAPAQPGRGAPGRAWPTRTATGEQRGGAAPGGDRHPHVERHRVHQAVPGRPPGAHRPPFLAPDRRRQRQRRRYRRVAGHPRLDHPRASRPQPGLHQGVQRRHRRLPPGRGRRAHEQRRLRHRPPLADQAPGLGLRRAPPGCGRCPAGRRRGDDPAPGRLHDAPHPHGPADGRLRARRQPVQHHPPGRDGRLRPGLHPP